MKKEKSNKIKGEERLDFAIGIITVVAVFAILTAVIVFAGNRTSGEIAHAGEARRGTEQVFTYNSPSLKKGETVTWFIDGQKMASYRYTGGVARFAYTPTNVGTSTVKVVAGRTIKTQSFNVGKPTLTLNAVNAEMTYGEEMPDLTYTVNGLVCDDCEDCVNCKVSCKEDISKCGEYEICVDEVTCEGYDVRCENATLTVKPKELNITGLEKVYDQTTELTSPEFVLEGICGTDEVYATAENVSFQSKNVGDYTVSTQNITLSGADSENYVLRGEAQGKIVPKQIALRGLVIADKNYDGTTKATISKMGTLQGVCEGDSVAVGSLDVVFENAEEGAQKINVRSVNLVGFDKDNYVVGSVEVEDANINR